MMARAFLSAALLLSLSLFAPQSAMAGDPHGGDQAAESHGDDHGGGHGDAHGDAHGGHGQLTLGSVLTNIEFIGTLVNFILLIFILVWLGKKPLGEFLTARRQAVKDGLDEAAQAKAEAQAKYDEYAGRLSRLDDEVNRLRATMMEAAEQEKARIIKESEEKARRLQEETGRLIDNQMKQLQSDVMQEVVDAAVSAAEAVLREKLNSQDQQKLAQDYVAQIKNTSKSEDRA
jgi:F-type H+-transporting ATPase subunit b